jgi:uncharacterized membrane protein YhaH (DUF805 family)
MDPENSPPEENTSPSSSKASGSIWQAILDAAKALPTSLLFVIIVLVILIMGGAAWASILGDHLFLFIFLGLIVFLVVAGVLFTIWHERRKPSSTPEAPQLPGEEEILPPPGNPPPSEPPCPEAYLSWLWDLCVTPKYRTIWTIYFIKQSDRE